MRKALSILGAAMILFMVSCDGSDGQDGFDGEDGIQAQVFEVDGVNFEYLVDANTYSSILAFQDLTAFEVLKEDSILVYRYDGEVVFDDGGVEDLWSLIPQSFFLTEGTIQYTNAHTTRDVEILIDGNFDLSALNTEFTQNQIFRIVIVPGEVASSAKTNNASLAATMNVLGITEEDVKKVSLNN